MSEKVETTVQLDFIMMNADAEARASAANTGPIDSAPSLTATSTAHFSHEVE
mgnify:CR=1 FL=1